PANSPFSIPRRRMRIAEDGSAWLGEGQTLARVGADGRALATVKVSVEPGEELGSFLLVPDGFITAFHRPSSPRASGRVGRLDAAGSVAWTTTLPVEAVAYAGVVEMGVESDWQARPKKPWQPEDWQPAWRGEPLLLSGNRLLARYFELSSGLGRSFCL